MRGKKSDPAFVSQFIQQSVIEGAESTEDIVNRAKMLIDQIDQEIKSIEAKKMMRSKLIDVVLSFEDQKKDKSCEAKLLPFFKLEYPDLCKEMCKLLSDKKDMLSVSDLIEFLPDGPTVKFCQKQLIENRILARVNDKIIRGEKFNDYVKFILDESK